MKLELAVPLPAFPDRARMDLPLLNTLPTDEERGAVDACLGPPTSLGDAGARGRPQDLHAVPDGAALRGRRHQLLPAFQAVQARIGWISEGALDYVCTRLFVSPAEARDVATFYSLLATTPRPRRVLHVCDDIACRCKGAVELCAALEEAVGPPQVQGPAGDGVALAPARPLWLRSPCLGMCDHAPAALLTEAGEHPFDGLLGDLTLGDAESILDPSTAALGDSRSWTDSREFSTRSIPQRGQTSLQLLLRVGTADPTSLANYRRMGGYTAMLIALDKGPEWIIGEVTASRLTGRGGAALPTGPKWAAVAAQPVTPHYLVCNADESEPGTFKDRVLLEDDPFAIVESMTIAAYATGCSYGYVYLRGEYPLAKARLQHAIDIARGAGLLGATVYGRPFAFDIEIRSGAGASTRGEETAIFNSIEGFRAEPRDHPPLPAESGLFQKPSLVNHVETLANIPQIVNDGGAAFAAIGSGTSTGPKLFCVSGTVRQPGVYEVPFGTTLRQLFEMAGGVAAGRTLQAIRLGGAAGVFVRPDELDMPLTFEGARAARASLASGAIMVFDDAVDLKGILLRVAEFSRDASPSAVE